MNKTITEKQWYEILVENANQAIKQCQAAGIQIIDKANDEWELDNIEYSPAMDKVYFRCK